MLTHPTTLMLRGAPVICTYHTPIQLNLIPQINYTTDHGIQSTEKIWILAKIYGKIISQVVK